LPPVDTCRYGADAVGRARAKTIVRRGGLAALELADEAKMKRSSKTGAATMSE